MFNPLKTIIKGASGLADKGRDFFSNVGSGIDATRENVYRGSNILKDKTLKQFDRSVLGGASKKAAKFQRNFNQTVKDIAGGSESSKDLRSRGIDETAKGTLRSGGFGLRTANRLNNANANSLSFQDQIKSELGQEVSGKKTVFNKIFQTASNIASSGADNLSRKADFIDEFDRESISLDQVKEDPSLTSAYYVQTLGQGLPSVALSTLGAITTGGLGAFAVGGAIEGGAQFEEAKAFGASDKEADLAGTLNGIISGALEAVGSSTILANNPLTKKISANVAKQFASLAGSKGIKAFFTSMITEAGTEATQQYVSNIIAKAIYDEERNTSEGVLEAGIGGAVLGSAINASGVAANTSIDIAQKGVKAYKEADRKSKQGGYINVDSKKEETLTTEAKKFDNVEDFVNSQPKMFHGTLTDDAKNIEKIGFKTRNELGKDSSFADQDLFGDVIFLTTDKKQAQKFAESMGTDRGISTFQGVGTSVLEVPNVKLNLAPKPKGGSTAKHFREEIEQLKKQGFDGIIDGKTRVVWNMDKLKTKSQLTDIFNQAKNTNKGSDLIAEAKKFDNVDDFIEKQGDTIFHHSKEKIERYKNRELGTWFTNNKINYQRKLGANISNEAIVNIKSLNLATEKVANKIPIKMGEGNKRLIKLKEQGFDGMIEKIDGDTQYLIFDADNIKTKSQLTDIFNKSKEKFQAPQSPQFTELSKKKASLQKEWDMASNKPAVRKRLEKAIAAIDKQLTKFQDDTTHTLSKSGYIATSEAVEKAMQIPAFREMAESGRIVLTDLMGNPDALGSFVAGTIKLRKGIVHKTTAAHETFHAIMGMVFNDQKRSETLDLAREESGRTEMTDRKAEEWIAQRFAEWNTKRTERTFSEKMIDVFRKIRQFLMRIEQDLPAMENLFNEIISEETATAIRNFQEEGGITEARKEFNQNPEVFTTQLFQDEQLWKKETQKRVTVEAAINRLRKPIMKEYALSKLETEFDTDDVIDMGQYKRALMADLLSVSIIESKTFSDYGLDSIGMEDMNITPKTYIINTNFKHGKTGHFGSDFDVTTKKEDLEIRELKGKHYVVRKGLTESNIEEGVFEFFDTDALAQEYINNFSDRVTSQKGMIGHFRAFQDHDASEGGQFNVVEIQSDVFQKGVASLVRDSQQLKAMEIKAASSSFKDRIKESERKVKMEKDSIEKFNEALSLIEEFENTEFESTESLKEEQVQLSFPLIKKLKGAMYMDMATENVYRDAIQRATVANINGKRKLKIDDYLNIMEDIDTLPEIRKKIESDLKDAENGLKDTKNNLQKKLDKINADPKWENSNLYFDEKVADEIKSVERDIESMENSISLMDVDSQAGTIVASEERLQSYKNKLADLNRASDTSSQKNEIELSKQFLSLKNNNHEQIINHAIRQAAQNGAESVRFPSSMTVAYVEGYVKDSNGGFSQNAGVNADEVSNLGVGAEIETQLGTGIITEIDSDTFGFVYSPDAMPLNTFKESEIKEDQEDKLREDFIYQADLREVQNLVNQKMRSEEGYNESLRDELYELDVEEISNDKRFSSVFEDAKEAYIENEMNNFDADDFMDGLYGDNFASYTDNDGDTFYIDTGGNTISQETLAYSQSMDKEDFKLSELADDHRLIAEKYGINDEGKKGVFYKYIEKKRGDLENVTDENGFTWFESKIQPSDRAAVELFQKKDQIVKNEEEIAELEAEYGMAGIQLKFKEEAVMSNPARIISKYAPTRGDYAGQQLQEHEKAQEIYNEAAGTDLYFEEIREKYLEYVADRDEFKQAQEEYRETKRENKKKIRELKTRVKFRKSGKRIGEIAMRREIKANQSELIKIIESSNLDLKDKGKFLRTVKNVQTESQFDRVLPLVEARIDSLETKSTVRILKAKVIKILKSTKLKNQNGKPVGKMTPEIQDQFDAMFEIAKMTQAQIDERMVSIISNSPDSPSVENTLELQMMALIGGLDNKSPEKVFQVMLALQNLRDEGRATRELQAFNRKTDLMRKIELTVDVITGGKGIDTSTTKRGRQSKRGLKERIKRTLKTLGQTLVLDWDGLMETLEFNSNVKDRKLRKIFSVNKEESEFKKRTADFIADMKFAIGNSYDIDATERNVAKKVRELSIDEINLGTFKNTEGQDIELIFTRDELIKQYMEFKDPEIKEAYSVGNKYTSEMFNAVESQLTEQDIDFADAQLEMYADHYNKVNAVYRSLYGVNLPQNEFYSPIRREGFKPDTEKGFGEFLEQSTQSAISQGFTKTRVKNNNPLMVQGSIAVLERHMNESNFFIAWAEKARELKAIFADFDIAQSIEQQFGDEFLNRIRGQVEQFITRGKGGKNVIGWVDTVRSNLTTASLAIKPAIMIKQLLSNPAVMELISPVAYTTGTVDFFSNPIKNWRTLNEESVVLSERGSNMERDIRDAVDSSEYSRFSVRRNVINTLMLNVKLGDKGAIMPAVWAYRKKLIADGLPMDEVIAEYEQFVSSTQQSSDLSKLAAVQKGGSFSKLFTMYMTSPRQYMQKELQAVKSLFREGGTKPDNLKKVAKTLFIYHVLLPFIFQFISNAGRLDDEAQKDYKRAMIIGPLNGIIIVGQFADSIVRAVLGQTVFPTNLQILQIIDDLTEELKRVDWQDFDWTDVVELTKASRTAVEAGTGLPIGSASRVVEGIRDVSQGKTKEGIGNILGWSDYSMTGKSPSDQMTPAERKMMPLYKDIAELKEQGNSEEIDKKLNTLSDEEYDTIVLLQKRKEKEELEKLKKTKEIKNIYEDIMDLKSEGDLDQIDDKLDSLTNEEFDAVDSLRKDKEKSKKKKDERSSQLSLSLQGVFIDPAMVITAAITKEEIRKVEGSKVVYKRMGFSGMEGEDNNMNLKVGDSRDVKEDMMRELGLDPSEKSKYKLEHIVPLTAGGRNNMDNLRIVTTAEHDSFTDFDIASGIAVQKGDISRRDAAQIARAYKNGEILRSEAMRLLKG